MRLIYLVLFVCSAPILHAADKGHAWERAKVLSQDLNTSQSGVYAAPIGTAVVGVPIYRTSNSVTVETDTQRLQWSEVGRATIILPVNGTIQFYRDGNYFVVMDSKNKKHKFALVGMTTKAE